MTIDEPAPDEIVILRDPRPFLRVYLELLLASLLGTIAVLPFTLSLLKQMPAPPPAEMLPTVIVVTIAIEMVLSSVAIGLGLWLGRKLGLDVPATDRTELVVDGAPTLPSTSTLALATVLGIATGLFALALGFGLSLLGFGKEGLAAGVKLPPAWECLLASAGAAVREEIWLRLGFLTVLAFLGTKLIGSNRLTPAVFWSSNVLAALLFGAIHLPQARALLGLSPTVVAYVLLGNGVPGVVFGWLFWRRGLLAAVVAHFWLDIVLKIIAPLFMS